MSLRKTFTMMKPNPLNGVSSLLRHGYLRNRRYYYDRYYGTDDPFVLGVKNFFQPRRLIMKMLYGQAVLPPRLSPRATCVESPPLELQWQGHLDALRRDGIVFVPGAFKRFAQVLSERYKITPEAFPPSDKYTRLSIDLNDPDIFGIATDPELLGVLAGYYGCQPYLRQLPAINCTHPESEKARESVGFNNYWHYDTVNQMTAHILLRDCTPTDSCMFYATRSHRTHRVALSGYDYYYSEEYIRDHFRIVPCVGEAGTVIIFDPNGLHRVDLKPGSFRSHLHLNFVPGNDIVRGEPTLRSGFPAPGEAQLAGLTRIQRQSIARVAPPAAGNG